MNDDGAPRAAVAGETATVAGEPRAPSPAAGPPPLVDTMPPSDRSPRLAQAVWRLLLPLAFAVALLLVALYPRQAFTLDIGQPGDRLFLSGVYGDERADGASYRWTGQGGPARLVVPGWGAVTTARIELQAQALPARGAVLAEVVSAGREVGALTVDGTMRWQAVEVALPGTGAALDLELRVPTTAVPGDSRQLGVKLAEVRLTPLDVSLSAYARQVASELMLPLLDTLLALLLVYRWAGVGGWVARGAAAGLPPLFAALYLPWALALGGFVALVLVLGLIARHAMALLDGAAALTKLVDRPRVAGVIAASAILIYGLVLAVLVWHVPWIGHADYADNAVVAANLVRGRGFSVDYVAQFYRAYPAVVHPADTWPPLQPMLIAPFFALFGVSTAAAKLPNIVVMMALLGLTFLVGARWWSPRAGLLAALFLALHNYLFNGVLYPLNDLVFTLLVLALLVQLALPVLPPRDGERLAMARPVWPHRVYWPAVGVLVGLLYLAKPSGLLLAGGAALWRLWLAWRQGQLRRVVTGGALAGLAALLVVGPWLVRNLITFGVPFYSTEQFDAWILKYQVDEAIYRVYFGRLPLPHPRLLVGYGFDWIAQVDVAQVRKFLRDVTGGALAPVALLPLGALGVVLLDGIQRRLWTPLLAGSLPYAAFVLLYWHYERRYTLYLLPWLMLAAAAALWWLHDRLTLARGARAATLATLVVVAFIVVPQADAMRNDAQAAQVTPSSVTIARWVAANTPPDAVVMTRNPWELSFHSGRRTVMIPYDSLDAILAVAKQYNVTYLQLDHLNDRYTRRAALGPLYDGEERFGFEKVYATPGWIVYRFPPSKP